MEGIVRRRLAVCHLHIHLHLLVSYFYLHESLSYMTHIISLVIISFSILKLNWINIPVVVEPSEDNHVVKKKDLFKFL